MKFRKFVNFIAYLGIIVLAIGLCLSAIPNKFGSMCGFIVDIAMWIEACVGLVYAYYFARSKEQSWFMFAFGVAIIAVITMVIIKLVA